MGNILSPTPISTKRPSRCILDAEYNTRNTRCTLNRLSTKVVVPYSPPQNRSDTSVIRNRSRTQRAFWICSRSGSVISCSRMMYGRSPCLSAPCLSASAVRWPRYSSARAMRSCGAGAPKSMFHVISRTLGLGLSAAAFVDVGVGVLALTTGVQASLLKWWIGWRMGMLNWVLSVRCKPCVLAILSPDLAQLPIFRYISSAR